MDKLKFELEYAPIPGVTVAFSVPFDLYGHQNPHSAADEHAVASVSESLLAAAAATEKSVPLAPKDAGRATVTSVSLEGEPFSMLRFEVPLPDGAVSRVYAPDYARATVLAAAKRAFEGKKFGALLDMGDAELAAALKASFHEGNLHSYGMPAYCEFPIADWRVAELSDGDLSDAQRGPMTFSLVRNAYGPEAIFRCGDDEYSVALEIDEGAVVARAYLPGDDDVRTDVRLARGKMQVEIGNGGETVAFDVDGDEIVRAVGDKLTQYGNAEPEPAPAA